MWDSNFSASPSTALHSLVILIIMTGYVTCQFSWRIPTSLSKLLHGSQPVREREASRTMPYQFYEIIPDKCFLLFSAYTVLITHCVLHWIAFISLPSMDTKTANRLLDSRHFVPRSHDVDVWSVLRVLLLLLCFQTNSVTNSMAYGNQRFSAAFTRALQ